MGGTSEQPYMYSPPTTYDPFDPYNGFNPKAVSQASFARQNPHLAQQYGGLDFNRHPDSYPIHVDKKPEVAPLPSNTPKRVKMAKRFQLGLRLVQVATAIGMLVPVICLQNMKDTEAWILRICPSLDVILCFYGIYNLVRSEKDKTPWNSAMYHIFATVMDAGLIPVYIFIGMLANANLQQKINTAGRWTSFFSSDNATDELMDAVYIVSGICCAFHAVSLFADMYLLIMFRRISKLPPDMNPLEEKKDNLTRRKTKHKYKNSELTLVDEKHLSSASNRTLVDDSKFSFLQSRGAHANFYSGHNPKTAESTRNMYQQHLASRVNLHRNEDQFYEDEDSYEYATRTSPMPAMPMSPKRSSQAGSIVSSLHSIETIKTATSGISAVEDEENWRSTAHHNTAHTQSPQPRRSHLSEITNMVDSNSPSHNDKQLPRLPRQPTNPLRMNPPTPPPQPIAVRIATQPISPKVDRQAALPMPFTSQNQNHEERSRTMLSAMTSSSAYSTEPPSTVGTHVHFDQYPSANGLRSVAAPKSRFYGDLASAMKGVRTNDGMKPRPKSVAASVYGYEDEEDYSSQGRVVSRSGADVMDTKADLGMMGHRRREVSGKIAEEGRGGYGAEGSWFGGTLFRRVSGRGGNW